MTEVLLPIRTWSEPNLRGHWGRRARRAHKQREAARLLVRAALVPLPPGTGRRKTVVRLTRIGPRRLDSDNLAAALKHVRDGLADALGMDDGDERLTWRYAQRNGSPGQYAVLVEVETDDKS
jgi:crossover junction endodeoxyribonuclease RusA